jgi:hypothetical protein
MKNKCGTCAYPIFAERVNGCYAILPVGDPLRNKRVEPDTVCFTGQWSSVELGKRFGDAVRNDLRILELKRVNAESHHSERYAEATN